MKRSLLFLSVLVFLAGCSQPSTAPSATNVAATSSSVTSAAMEAAPEMTAMTSPKLNTTDPRGTCHDVDGSFKTHKTNWICSARQGSIFDWAAITALENACATHNPFTMSDAMYAPINAVGCH